MATIHATSIAFIWFAIVLVGFFFISALVGVVAIVLGIVALILWIARIVRSP